MPTFITESSQAVTVIGLSNGEGLQIQFSPTGLWCPSHDSDLIKIGIGELILPSGVSALTIHFDSKQLYTDGRGLFVLLDDKYSPDEIALKMGDYPQSSLSLKRVVYEEKA